jgi:cytochrome c-type biogenesis protein CcmH
VFKKMMQIVFLSLLLGIAILANADQLQISASDQALEKRVTAVSEELRCLVCQNQNIADSHAELAIDLKNQVREKLQQGMSERQVLDYMVHRYGDFVLYRPPVKAATWLLWFGPFLLLSAGVIMLLLILKRRRPQAQIISELSASDMRRAAQLLDTRADAKDQL